MRSTVRWRGGLAGFIALLAVAAADEARAAEGRAQEPGDDIAHRGGCGLQRRRPTAVRLIERS